MTGPALRWFLAELRPRWRGIALVFAAGAAPVLLNLPALWLIRYVFDTAIPMGDTGHVLLVVAALALCRLAYAGCAYWAAAATAAELRKVTAALRMSFVGRLLRANLPAIAALDSTQIHGRLVVDSERVEVALNAAFNAAAPALVPVIVFTAIMAFLSWPLALALALLSPLLHAPLWPASKRVQAKTAEFQSAFERFSSSGARSIRMLSVSRMQGTEAAALSAFHERVTGVANAGVDMTRAHALYAQTNGAIMALAAAIVLAGGGAAVASGALSLGALAAFTMAASIAGTAANRIVGAVPALVAGQQAILRLFQTIEAAERAQDAGNGTKIPDHNAALALRGVSVIIGGRQVLRNASLDIAPGKVTVIAGKNGQGKSTLIGVLLGLIRPESGSVMLGDTPLEMYAPTAFRERTGIVPQGPVLVKGSFRDNVAFGRPYLTETALYNALYESGAAEKMMAIGATLDTPIGDEGRSLSGGEAQCVAIARALAHDPRILFLDEPSNHLDDAAVDGLIEKVIRPRHVSPEARRTIVIATHDPRIVAAADVVYDLAFGAVALRQTTPARAVS